MLLADFGAEVTKVEQKGTGDVARRWGPPFVGPPDGQESTYFLAVNRGKRSVELDFHDPADRRRLLELVRSADILVENFRTGVAERLGIGTDQLSAINPRLVSLSISGFGQVGEDRSRPGFDQIVQGEAGISWLGRDADGRPMKSAIPLADIFAGTFGALGIVSALFERATSGRGQGVSTSLLGSMIAIHTFHASRWLIARDLPTVTGNHHPSIAPYGTFDCSDGMINIAVGTQDEWRRFARALGVDADYANFATNAARVSHFPELESHISAELKHQTVESWIDRLTAADVPVGRIRSIDQVYDWDQVRQLGQLITVEHSVLGPITLPGSPIAFTRSVGRPSMAPPTLGQHNAEIFGPGDLIAEQATDHTH